MPSTNSVPGSRTGQACPMNALKLRLAFSSFTDCSWNLGSFQEPVEVLEFFVAKSRVVNRGFIVYSMGQFDLFGLRRETLQQRLNSPGFALARAFPKQRGRLFGGALFNQRRIETVTLRDIQPVSVRLFSGWFLALRSAFPSFPILSERSSPSRVRYAAPNTGAPLTAPGRSGAHP